MLPFSVTATLTANPKGIEDFYKEAELDAEMKAKVDNSGRFTVTRFKLQVPGPISYYS